ncbi:Xaa-Pro peptidase family protein [Candidatus Bathyarchaeota archaeon]|nr:Xaa-Pro peptidase family protein [Candidatus Bathyarchaeota archaeon]
MEKKGIDALIATTGKKIQYLTDISGMGGFAVLPREKNLDPFLVTGILNAAVIVTSPTWVKDIRYRGGAYFYATDPKAKLTEQEKKMKAAVDSAVMDARVPHPATYRSPSQYAEVLKGLQERGLDKCKIGIEDGISVGAFEKLKKAVPEAEIVFADDIFEYASMVKTADELKIIEEGVPILDKAWVAVCEAAKPGVTEGELVKAFKIAAVSYGHEGAGIPYNMTLGIGRRSSVKDSGIDRHAKLKKGDLIAWDSGLIYKNYDVHDGRTAVLGEPENPNVIPYYQALLDAENAGLEAVRPGIKASEVYQIMIDAARKTIPYFERHHNGHSLGLLGYETPAFMPNDPTPLEEGMVFNIEPSAFVEFGLGALRLEDTILITKKGYKLYNTISRDLWRL